MVLVAAIDEGAEVGGQVFMPRALTIEASGGKNLIGLTRLV
ncbi:MAG: hypothetical protein WBW81_12730 [Methylocella sp.]